MHLETTKPRLWDVLCAQCPDGKTRIENADLDPGLPSLFFVDLMLKGGCPIGQNDLTSLQWATLGVIRESKSEVLWLRVLKSLSVPKTESPVS
jgi:hypothetical protein